MNSKQKWVLGLTVIVVILLARGVSRGRPGADQRTGVAPPSGGAWVDEIVFREEADISKAVEMIEAGAVDAYATGTDDPEVFRRIQASQAIEYDVSYGLSYDLTFNPVGPVLSDGRLNPFHVPAIREAMNRLVDRNHIAEEIFGGLAVPRFFPLSGIFPDYARLADVARPLEVAYGHDPAAAGATIAREMERLGARRPAGGDGKWRFRGKPVRLIFLIRPDDRRREIGDYVATLLENVGFEVERQYKTAAEAAPIWIGSDPAAGGWHLYTGAWVSPAISRDDGKEFFQMYTPRGRPEPLWQAYRPSPRFDRVAERLGTNDYATWKERMDLMAEALELSLKDSVRVWLADTRKIWPRRRGIDVASDLASGVTGSDLFPYTLRFRDRSGGRVQFASPSLLTEPWNPVAGTNWVFDKNIIRTTLDFATLPDPFTGLYHPQRIQSAEVHVLEGLPVQKTLGWVDLQFVPSIVVPPDAEIDWDAERQRWITVGEKYPRGLTARVKIVIRYDTDLFERRWHDGTRVSLADFRLADIIPYERADPKSPIYDEATVAEFELSQKYSRGSRIVQENPLVVEVYSDRIFADAEQLVALAGPWANPTLLLYEASVPWHALAIGILSDSGGEAAFSPDKADRNRVERMNYIAGPTLAILDRALDRARTEAYIPYASVLGRYIDAAQARARYEALAAWRRDRGHFWVGNGPFYLHSVSPVEKLVVVRKFAGFTDPPDRWLRFSDPKIPQVDLTGPRTLAPGDTAAFEAAVSFRDAPYPADEIEAVRFLFFDARGRLVRKGVSAFRDGRWRIDLAPQESALLPEGSNRLEVIVTSRLVTVPAVKSHLFVTAR